LISKTRRRAVADRRDTGIRCVRPKAAANTAWPIEAHFPIAKLLCAVFGRVNRE
jgi:hypothetical protein